MPLGSWTRTRSSGTGIAASASMRLLTRLRAVASSTSAVAILREQVGLELFVVGTRVIVRIGISHGESRRARCRALHASRRARETAFSCAHQNARSGDADKQSSRTASVWSGISIDHAAGDVDNVVLVDLEIAVGLDGQDGVATLGVTPSWGDLV